MNITEGLSDDDLRNALVAVGANPEIDPVDFDTSFEDLDLDSLARTELASRISSRFQVETEDRMTLESTPNEVRSLVRNELSTRVVR